MNAVQNDEEWTTHFVTDPTREVPKFGARDLFRQIAKSAWACGDPGLQFDDAINRWNTCSASGRINASNPCVTGDTLIATKNGLIPIDRLVGKETEIYGSNGKLHKISGSFRTGKKNVYKVTTQSGYSVKATEDHRFLTVNGSDVALKDLSIKDKIQLSSCGFGCDSIDTETAEIIGASIGDGCVCENTLNITIGKQNKSYAEHLANNVTSLKRKLLPSTLVTKTSLYELESTFRISLYNKDCVNAIQKYAVLDKYSEGKAFTDEFFLLDRKSQGAALRALFTCDGTVGNYKDKTQYISLDSTSLTLLNQVQLLLLNFEIKSKIYQNRKGRNINLRELRSRLPDGKGGYKDYNVSPMHSLRISRSSRNRFEVEIGFMPMSHKQPRLHEMNQTVSTYQDKFVDRVVAIEPCGKEDVFDLTEPVTEHFYANGICVHNCSEFMGLDHSACNLASLNLLQFKLADGTFDRENFIAACGIMLTAQDILIDRSSYPTKEIAETSHRFRPVGLGYTNLGAYLMTSGLAYDSDEARSVCAELTATLQGAAYRASVELAGREPRRAVGAYAPLSQIRLRCSLLL